MFQKLKRICGLWGHWLSYSIRSFFHTVVLAIDLLTKYKRKKTETKKDFRNKRKIKIGKYFAGKRVLAGRMFNAFEREQPPLQSCRRLPVPTFFGRLPATYWRQSSSEGRRLVTTNSSGL